MCPQTSPVTVAIRLTASLLLLVFGISALLSAGLFLLPGLALAAGGIAGLVYTGLQFARERRDRPDPYDLTKLWDKPPPEPEVPERESYDDDLVLCHRCGASMPAHVGICLECGNRLGH
jgi:hypothetical protein